LLLPGGHFERTFHVVGILEGGGQPAPAGLADHHWPGFQCFARAGIGKVDGAQGLAWETELIH